ncbi:adenylate cyclase type 9-like isoform X2 [Homalodisca vitripennis]|uniref:adenylate cyclase type 9-like isoform X2 n=1 Tax=Homalodisca vitripennis TaxID=197043 RepID=UPI001EEB9826|nr:adenylate cyclase type 9-like isoform X2 [Homalodisca vitripennis]
MDEKNNEPNNRKQDIKSNTSVSFSREYNEINITPEEYETNEDDIQISLAPYIQVYLAQSSQRVKCCGLSFPIPFERAASRSWWDPRFDSEILEGQYKLSAFPQIRLRFRYSLLYVFVVSLFWCIYLTIKAVHSEGKDESFTVALIFGSFSIFTLFILLFTRSSLYARFHLPVSIMTAIVMFALSLMSVGTISVLTPVGDFSLCIEILMIIYTVIPLPLYICVMLGIAYSVLFELFISSIFPMPLRVLCHICVHLIGIHILVMTHVRMRGTFMKVGQSLLVRRQLELEKQLKEKMIHSVMPPKVADWLMSEGATGGKEDEVHSLEEGDIRSIFRPFNMHRMENVSILFADIVGFTKMSSTKTAEQLVAILNDLFERFDELCTANGCEKISTLGDCYYCVSGCPEPRPDHAECCVQMGLGMISAIAEFEKESREGVNMRVGVHTGTVLCGIVGTKRVKFDVWSNDVTLANKMESTGKPGMVHLSEKTKEFLNDQYILEEGDLYQGLKTYFVKGRKIDTDLSKSSLTVPSYQTNHSSPSSPARRSSISLATAISIHINQTAALEEVLNSSQSLSLRTPSPESEQYNSFSFSPPPQSPVDRNSLSPPSEIITIPSPTMPSSRSRSPIHRVLQISSSWKTASLPSILDTEGSDHPDVVPNKEEYLVDNRSSVSLSKKRTSPKWVYKKIPTSPPDGQDVTQELLGPQHPIDMIPTVMLKDDQKSVCPSMNSRKDSGIRSNSRKSSIQHPFNPTNGSTSNDLLGHRVSGYYTSSQSSMNNEAVKNKLLMTSAGDHYGVSFQKLRKQSDLQLIRCVQDNSLSQRSYFVKPPLHSVSLFFRQKDMEREYRRKAHRSCKEEASTLATARFNTHLDIAVAILVFLLMLGSCLVLFGMPSGLLPFFLLLCAVQSLALILCLRSVFWPELNSGLDQCSDWFSWHFIGGVLVSLPMITILLFLKQSLKSFESIYYFASLYFIGIIHFCNFTQLNCWMKSSIATVAGLIYLIMITNYFQSAYDNSVVLVDSMRPVNPVPLPNLNDLTNDLLKPVHPAGGKSSPGNLPNDILLEPKILNENFTNPPFVNLVADNKVVSSRLTSASSPPPQDSSGPSGFHHEIYLDVLLILLLVWFLNREFEISYRLSFHGNMVAARDKAKVQMMKDQAELLLHNIIPKHVAEHLKTTAKYSENVRNAGIIFASIINFSEMYDESYLGGRECLRVLNELVSDFDELLSKPEFASVEKIKTIGSTYMAASGLNPSLSETDSCEHLHALVEFALRLQAVVDLFNKDLLEFNLILRIGYSFGDITAGVIGTTKLYYDIWGDAVNIASRMDSTGVAGRIQVPSHCVPALEDRYIFEKRGQVYVKGKDNMIVYLLVGKK